MQVNLTDPGFLYGQGVFETMRTYEGKIFRLDDHLSRLIYGLKAIGIDPTSKQYLKKIVLESIRRKKATNARIKLIVWQGSNKINYAIIISKLDVLPKCFSATISAIRQNENSPLCHVKSLNYLSFILARKFAQEKNFDEALLLNSAGILTEGTRTNLFFVKNNCLFTPSLDCGCLCGVTRKVVFEIANKYKIKLIEGRFKKESLFSCDEAFLTNSLIEVMPLAKINNRKINCGKIGAMAKFLQNSYKREIASFLEKKCYNLL